MRKLIAAMKVSIDGKTEGSEGYADWVDAWSDDYGLTSEIDACVLGAGMYPNYESYWTNIQDAPDAVNPLSGGLPTPAEVDWARFAARTPHYVVSTTITDAKWANTTVLKTISDVAALKVQAGKGIYLMGGARILGSCLQAGLIDELRLIVYPLIAGDGPTLFPAPARHGLELRGLVQLTQGRVSMNYALV